MNLHLPSLPSLTCPIYQLVPLSLAKDMIKEAIDTAMVVRREWDNTPFEHRCVGTSHCNSDSTVEHPWIRSFC